jgi:hypothetical protein
MSGLANPRVLRWILAFMGGACAWSRPVTVWAGAALTTACAGQCGALGGLPPEKPPLVHSAEGARYLVTRGAYKAFYDREGRLQRLEHDANGDGHPEQVSHHDGQRIPALVEVDQDSDGKVDRWEQYDSAGVLTKVGTSRRGGRPDAWSVLNPEEVELQREYDDDGDGRVERRERRRGGRVAEREVDADRDGTIDRWQTIREGRLVEEQLDTDGDGRPDRRLRYGGQGQILALEILAAR